MTRKRAFEVLGVAWSAMIAFELFVMTSTSVSTGACIAAIFLRGVLAGAAFGCARVAAPKQIAVGYAVAPVVIALVGLGMSVSPGSTFGFLAFSREDTYDRMPNVFVPEIRQAMNASMRASFAGILLCR